VGGVLVILKDKTFVSPLSEEEARLVATLRAGDKMK
jgi:hypothetical protein